MLGEARAHDDVVGLAAQGVLGHLPRAFDRPGPLVEVVQVRLEHLVAAGDLVRAAVLVRNHAAGLSPAPVRVIPDGEAAGRHGPRDTHPPTP